MLPSSIAQKSSFKTFTANSGHPGNTIEPPPPLDPPLSLVTTGLPSTTQPTATPVTATPLPAVAVTSYGPAPGTGLIAVVNAAPSAHTHVLTVGVGEAYATLAAAIGASVDGDLIRVDAGTYTNDFASIHTKITIEGVGGMVKLVATIAPPDLKGILTVDNDVTIRNLAFSGSAVADADGGNGAGIRYEGGQMVLVNDSFIGNQDGLLAVPVLGYAVNTITIDHSLFSANGSGTGYTHNLYVGAVDKLTVTGSIFEKAIVGHEFKSRAIVNDIENNIFRDGPTATASYDIDLPNGGQALIKNNLIEKGPMAENNSAIHYGGEGIPYAGSSLTIAGNILVNDKGAGATAVLNQTGISVAITANTIVGFAAASILAGPGVETKNIDGSGVTILDSTLTGVLPGATTVYTDNLAHSITLNGSTMAVQGGGGRLTVSAIGGHVVAIGGSGGIDLVEGPSTGGNSFTTAASSVNSLRVNGQDLIDSEGTDRIIAGNGNITGQIAGTATIDDGFNDDKWTLTGTAKITGHGGRPTVQVSATGNLKVDGQVGFLHVIGNGGQERYNVVQGGTSQSGLIIGGAVDLQLYSGRFTMVTAAGPIGALIRMGAGDGQIVSAGHDIIYAGSGQEIIIVSGQAEVHAGTGTLSVFGRGITGVGAKFYGNGGSYTIDGDSGNIIYYGGSLTSTVQDRLSNITLVGGSGLLTINGGSRATITGGSGGIRYTAGASEGANSISTAAGSKNFLAMSGGNNLVSWGNDTVQGGIAFQTMAIHGDSSVTGSTSGGSYTFSGNDKLIGIGHDTVEVTAGAHLVVSAGSWSHVHETTATVAFSVDGNAATAVGGGATFDIGDNRAIAITTDAGAATDLMLDGGSVAVYSQGADSIHAGSGADTIVLTRADANIWGGAGQLSISNYDWAAGDAQIVQGGTGAITYSQSVGNLTFVGGSGDATIDGGGGQLLVTAGSGNTTVTGGSAAGFKFVAGAGSASIALTPNGGELVFGTGNTSVSVAGWGAGAVFDFVGSSGGGSDVIRNFRVGTDRLNLAGVSVQSQQIVGGSANLVLSDNTRLLLTGVTNTAYLFG